MTQAVNQSPGACGCAGASILFRGCNSLALPNYAIDIYASSGGALLESVTTDATGHASVHSTGSVWIQGHDGRFSGQTLTIAATTDLTVVGSAYVCVPCVPIPISKTLFFTSALFGTITLTWVSGSKWTACTTYTTTARTTCNSPCTSGSVAIPIFLQVQFSSGPCTVVLSITNFVCNGLFCAVSTAGGGTCTTSGLTGGIANTTQCSATYSVAPNTAIPFNVSGSASSAAGCVVAAGSTLAFSE